MAKPIVNNIQAFDASKSYTVTLMWSGRYESNTIYIYNAITGTLVRSISNPGLSNEIPAGLLTNGGKYYIGGTVTYKTTVSELSNYVFFVCYSEPTFKFESVPNQIDTSSVTVNLTYAQAQGRPLQSYIFYLYDNNHKFLTQSDTMYDNTLSYTYKNLQDASTYYIRATGSTVDGMELDTTEYRIMVNYAVKSTYVVMSLYNDNVNGWIKYGSNLHMIDYHGDELTPEHDIVNGMVDTRNDKWLYYNDGFTIQGDFALRADVKDLNVVKDDANLVVGYNYPKPLILIKNDKYQIKLTATRIASKVLKFKLVVTSPLGNYICYSQDLNTLSLFTGTIIIRRKGSLYGLTVKEA